MMKPIIALIFSILFALFVQNESLSSDRLCVDEKCIGIISLGKAVRNYAPDREGILAFKANSEVKIKSKSSDSPLWGVEIDGKDGYAPKMFIQEYKVYYKMNSLVKGLPEVLPPKRTKSKLKGSEKKNPETDSTTTAPLPKELEKEKILTDDPKKDASEKETVLNVSPSSTVEVVDGTKIPVESDVAKNATEVDEDEGIVEDVDSELKSIEEDTNDDDEDEEDDEGEDDDDDVYFEEVIEKIPLKAEVATGEPEKKNLSETEIPPVTNSSSLPTTFSGATKVVESNSTDSESAASLVDAINEVGNETIDSKIDIQPTISQSVGDQGTQKGEKAPETTPIDSTEAKPIEPEPEADLFLQKTAKPDAENVSSDLTLDPIAINAEVNVSAEADKKSEITPENVVASEAEGSQKKEKDEEAPTVISDPKESIANVSTDLPAVDTQEEPANTNESVKDATIRPEVEIAQQEEVPTIPPVEKDGIDRQEVVPTITPVKEAEAAEQDKVVPTIPPAEEAGKAQPEGAVPTITSVKEAEAAGQDKVVPTIPPAEEAGKAQPEEVVPTITPVKEAEAAGQDKVVPTIPPAEETRTAQAEEVVPTIPPLSAFDILRRSTPPTLEPKPSEETVKSELQGTDPTESSREEVTEKALPVSDPISEENDSTEVPEVTENPTVVLERETSTEESAEVSTPASTSFESNSNELSEPDQVTEVPLTPTEPEISDLIDDPLKLDDTTPSPVPRATPQTPPAPQVGLFQTILGTVKGLLPSQEPPHSNEFSDELDRILFPKKEPSPAEAKAPEGYCEREANCPSNSPTSHFDEAYHREKDFFESLSDKVLEVFNLLACMAISASATLLFTFGYYCISQCRKEHELIAKLNVMERSLLASNKEASILKHDLGETCDKLASIENNSFGSNDMVIAIKKELEISEEAKARLEDQIVSLEKELENAAEAGLELNRIVSELLNNQSGDESIISSVEELQKQLNEQQNTILEINAILADKSRENSELQLILAEQNAKFNGEVASLQQDNDELEAEKNVLKSKLDEMKTEFEQDITKALEGKNAEIKRLQSDIVGLRTKYEDEHRKWQTSVAKVEALEECLKTVKRDPNVKVSQIIDVANVQAELLDIKRERTSLKEKLESEQDARKILEEQVNSFGEEVNKLKYEYNQSVNDKLEAQTRLEVLSNYFKDKETQLQKELSLKEAMWLKQQGETTSTVDRLTSMQDEIQTLKSQNDSLRAEVEAQLAAHKAQIGTLENRAHESWLAARQSERKYEEARSDATALRRKLTSLVGGNMHNVTKENNLDGNLPPVEMNNAPSPVHMEAPGSPITGRVPPPPFIPPPFLGPPPPHFMGIPPFMPPGKMRLPPMGRLMSPPPPPGAPHMHRYSPIEDDDDDDDIRESNRGHWRDSYSPPRNSYRYSPDRYMYNSEVVSNYDTETDFSPPPSPRERSHRSGSRSGSYKAYSPPPQSNHSMDRPKKSSKGHTSSGSEKSENSWAPWSK